MSAEDETFACRPGENQAFLNGGVRPDSGIWENLRPRPAVAAPYDKIRKAAIDAYETLLNANAAGGVGNLERILREQRGLRPYQGGDVAALYLRVIWGLDRDVASEIGVFLKQALLRGMTSKNVQAAMHVTW
jgi:hypothetical protein